MKIKKEYIILAGIIILSVLYLILHETDRELYKLPNISIIESKDITKLEIKRPNDSTILNKKDNKWYIEPEDYLADQQGIKAILDVIDDLTVTALVSESKNFIRYNLSEDRKIIVKAWAGNTLQRIFEIGKSAPTHQHTFVHLIDDPNIYHARGNFRRKFDKSAENLRDKTVLTLDKKQIQKMEITKGKVSSEYIYKTIAAETEEKQIEDAPDAKKTAPKMEWKTADNKEVDETMMNRLLDLFVNLKCTRYIYDKTKEDFKDPVYTFKIDGIKDVSLSLFDEIEKDITLYPAISSENDYPFYLSDSHGKNIIEKIDKLNKPTTEE